MIHVIAIIKVKENHVEEVENELLKLIKPTRETDKGCIQYDLTKSDEDPSLFIFVEKWESKELLDRHAGQAHVQKFVHNTDGLLDEFTVHVLTQLA
ncbi:antibiotic biosynthesis monooxygenase [bacterium]|nr:antibiotic biosynthesis monooxygenase [bacterium]